MGCRERILSIFVLSPLDSSTFFNIPEFALENRSNFNATISIFLIGLFDYYGLYRTTKEHFITKRGWHVPKSMFNGASPHPLRNKFICWLHDATMCDCTGIIFIKYQIS